MAAASLRDSSRDGPSEMRLISRTTDSDTFQPAQSTLARTQFVVAARREESYSEKLSQLSLDDDQRPARRRDQAAMPRSPSSTTRGQVRLQLRPQSSSLPERNIRGRGTSSRRRRLRCPATHRTVILIGSTGNGKSTLANVIAGCARGQCEFVEGDFATGQTQEVSEKTFSVPFEGIVYTFKIVDTIGINDGKISREEVLRRLTDVIHSCLDGIHQVLFVTKGRFSSAEMDAWKVVSTVIFQPDVIDYTTIVRTHADNCNKPGWVAKDLDRLCAGDDDVANLCKALRSKGRIFHVCNPNEDSGVPTWYERRQETHDRLLTHLIFTCTVLYMPPQIQAMHERVAADRESIRLKDIEIHALRDEKRKVEAQAEKARENERRREEEFRRETEAMRQATGNATNKARLLSQQEAAIRKEMSKQHSENDRLAQQLSIVTKRLEEAEAQKETFQDKVKDGITSSACRLVGSVFGPAGYAIGGLVGDGINYVRKDVCSVM